jgi:hypothetical protein
VRRLILAGLIAAISIVSVEFCSSYILYRHFAKQGTGFQPSGLAVVDLVKRVLTSHFITVSSAGGRVFGRDDTMGFIMFPGQFLITEHNAGKAHVFHLRVNERGERSTSYATVHAPQRIFLTGDSGMFGWGVDDEDTFAWLLQTRLPSYEVRNLSMTSYSTVHALLQLKQLDPQAGPEDIVVLVYHPITNDFNVASHVVLKPMVDGFEVQLGDAVEMRAMTFPYAVVDARGALSVQRIAVDCAPAYTSPGCAHPDMSREAAQKVTERVLDEIVATTKAHLMLAVINNEKDDSVIDHARALGITLVDLREAPTDGEAVDVIAVDGHAGPFWHHFAFLRLLDAMRQNRLID